jgi:hypothetical protein
MGSDRSLIERYLDEDLKNDKLLKKIFDKYDKNNNGILEKEEEILFKNDISKEIKANLNKLQKIYEHYNDNKTIIKNEDENPIIFIELFKHIEDQNIKSLEKNICHINNIIKNGQILLEFLDNEENSYYNDNLENIGLTFSQFVIDIKIIIFKINNIENN